MKSEMKQQGEIILYQPDETVRLEVRLENETDVYHIGASLKDLGKKMFAFSKLDIPAAVIIDLL